VTCTLIDSVILAESDKDFSNAITELLAKLTASENVLSKSTVLSKESVTVEESEKGFVTVLVLTSVNP